MGFEYTSGGDPLRSLMLLWRRSVKQGRSGLTLDGIVEAAVALADTEGLEALSMRRVAERLGTGAMSLYTHVPSKSELIDLMVDTALGELYAGAAPAEKHRLDWKNAVRYIAEENRRLFERHPWMLSLAQSRPEFGPNMLRKYELELVPLDGIGLRDIEMDSCLALVLGHTEAVARSRYHAQETKRKSGMSDLEWWEKIAPLLERMLDYSPYPVSSRVGTAAGTEFQAVSDPEHQFRFGLERIIDGIEMLIGKNRGGT